MTPSRMSKILEFWAILVGPWALDILGGRGILTTVFGASIWGMAVVVAAVRPLTRDPAFRSKLGWALGFLSGAWLTYWGLAYVEAPRRIFVRPEFHRWLGWFHGGLLAAGLGMVLVLWAASALWLVQDKWLLKSSWERRRVRWRLPSLEALGAVCARSVQLAFSSWGLGLFLAILTAMLRWQSDPLSEQIAVAWWLDKKVLGTALLWLALAAGFQISISVSPHGRWVYRSYIGLATLFIVFFSWLLLGAYSGVHGPLNWFVQ